jgi:hypothetical protein
MVQRKMIETFLSKKILAVVGVSRDSQQFANMAYRLLKERGYTVYAVNPNAEHVEGDRCYPNIASLPVHVEGVVVMLPPQKTIQVLPEIAQLGIRSVWLQQQTDSPEALQFCADHQIDAVYGECILMFLEPLGFPHRLHRWGLKLFGKYPTEG